MTALYSDWTKKKSVLARVAGELRQESELRGGKNTHRISPLIFMTDPDRVPDPVSVARRLPEGSTIIYRHFGNPEHAEDLRQITRERGQQLLIGNDPELAEKIHAQGVHFARDPKLVGPITWRAKHPDWIITMAGLKDGGYLAPLDSLDALFVSSIFPSRSASAGTPIGVETLKDRAARLPVPIVGLGGIDAGTAPALLGTGIIGLAAIEGLIMDVKKEVTSSGHRFVIKTEAGEAELTLAKAGERIFNANHTFTPNALRGRGIAGKLYAAMVADAKTKGYKIIPGCPYIEVKFKRHPDDRTAVGV
jgi:thiamine-phosphate pyrophosphorylase